MHSGKRLEERGTAERTTRRPVESAALDISTNTTIPEHKTPPGLSTVHSSSFPSLSDIVPYDQRFSLRCCVETPVLQHRRQARSVKRIKLFWNHIKEDKANLINFVSSLRHPINKCDLRPYVAIQLLGKTVYGLLGSGAQITCIGGSLARELIESRNLKPKCVTIRTADGREQQDFGRCTLEVTYNDETEQINFYIIPTISQTVILGVDFWSKFQISPNVIACLAPGEAPEPNHISLTPTEQKQLDSVKQLFPSYEVEGL